MMDDDESLWLARVRAGLDAAVGGIDAATLARLRAARRAALAAGGGGRQPAAALPWAAGAAALAGWLALSVWLPAGGGAPVPEPVPALAQVLAEEPVELLEELDFYTWLATEDGAAAGGGRG